MRMNIIACSIATIAFALPARADEARKGDAKALATRGDTEFYAGRCDRAIPLWREAEAAYHAPTILLRIARCEAILGRVVTAATMLEAIGREALDGDAPAAFFVAREHARRETAAVRARVATIEISVDARNRAPVVIELDGVTRAAGEVPVDPGERSLRVRAGASSFHSVIKLREGERRAMRVSLGDEPEPRSARTQRGVGIAAIALGGASVAVGLGLTLGAELDERRSPLAPAGTTTLVAGALVAVAGAITLAAAPSRKDAWRLELGATSFTIAKSF